MNRRIVAGGLLLALCAAGLIGLRGSRSVATAAVPQVPIAIDVVTHTEKGWVTVELPGETVALLGAALAAHSARSSNVEGALAAARAGLIDPVELGNLVRARVEGHPELGRGLLQELLAERSPPIAMQLAQALAIIEEDAKLRDETVEALRAAPPESRAVGLMALMGRGEPEVLELAADSFAEDAPEARATAGFVLNNAPDGPEGKIAEPVLEAARDAISDAGTTPRLREEAATLLGRKDATDADVALLERLAEDGDVSVRARALAALEATGMDRGRLLAIFERVARDAASPEPLALMAKAYLFAPR